MKLMTLTNVGKISWAAPCVFLRILSSLMEIETVTNFGTIGLAAPCLFKDLITVAGNLDFDQLWYNSIGWLRLVFPRI